MLSRAAIAVQALRAPRAGPDHALLPGDAVDADVEEAPHDRPDHEQPESRSGGSARTRPRPPPQRNDGLTRGRPSSLGFSVASRQVRTRSSWISARPDLQDGIGDFVGGLAAGFDDGVGQFAVERSSALRGRCAISARVPAAVSGGPIGQAARVGVQPVGQRGRDRPRARRRSRTRAGDGGSTSRRTTPPPVARIGRVDGRQLGEHALLPIAEDRLPSLGEDRGGSDRPTRASSSTSASANGRPNRRPGSGRRSICPCLGSPIRARPGPEGVRVVVIRGAARACVSDVAHHVDAARPAPCRA